MSGPRIVQRSWAELMAPRAAWTWLVGAALGGTAAWFWPEPSRAETTIFFPSVNTPIFRRLQPDPSPTPASGLESLALPPSPTGVQVVELARQVLASRLAAAEVEKQVGLHSRLGWGWSAGSAAERLRTRWLALEPKGASTLQIQVRGPGAETALALAQGYLDYYRKFLTSTGLTHTRRSRLWVEKELFRVADQMKFLESKVLASGASDSQDIRLSESVRAELWKRRLQDAASTEAALDLLSELREGEGPEPATAPPRLGRKALSRARIQRIYQDCAALHRALLLEYAQVRLMENLDSAEFEVIDPPRLLPASGWRQPLWALLGALTIGLIRFIRIGRRWRKWFADHPAAPS